MTVYIPQRADSATVFLPAMVIARIKAENVGSMLLIDDVKAGVIKQAVLNPTTLCMAFYFCLANIPGERR